MNDTEKAIGRQLQSMKLEQNKHETRKNHSNVNTIKADQEVRNSFLSVRATTYWKNLPEEALAGENTSEIKAKLDRLWKETGINFCG